MVGSGRTRRGLRRLDRTVYFLVALAALADHAAASSWPLRWLCLWYLRKADAVTRDFIAGTGLDTERRLSSLIPATTGHSQADALALAIALRWLAEIVRIMATRCRRQAFFGRDVEPSRVAQERNGEDRTAARHSPVVRYDTS